MLQGLGSDFTVASRIIEDFGQKRKMNGYTLAQTLEKVIMRRESVIGSGSEPSYVWWHMENRGELEIIADMGKRDRRRSIVVDTYEQDGGQRLLGWGDKWPHDYLYEMITTGISLGQQVLSRCHGGYYRTSYEYEEYDLDWHTEIIFVDYSNGIDIPLTFENPFKRTSTLKLGIEA